jgi:hypothetical protein
MAFLVTAKKEKGRAVLPRLPLKWHTSFEPLAGSNSRYRPPMNMRENIALPYLRFHYALSASAKRPSWPSAISFALASVIPPSDG